VSTDRPPVEYRPIVLLEPGQPPRRFSVRMVRLDSAARARELLAAGKAAWVSEEDAERVTSGETA